MEHTAHKIALVTGGSRGLGENAALRIADHGRDVIITYHSNADAARATVAAIEAKGQRAKALQLDVRNVSSFQAFGEQVKSTVAEWGAKGIDYLVNNAGTGAHAMLTDTDEATFDNLVDTHFKGVYFLTQHLLPVLNDGGRIVNISTGLTRFTFPGYSAYAAMKGAIETYTKYLAKELGPRGIGANLVAPGAIDNDFNKDAFDHNPQMRDTISGITALGRVGVSDDIGGIVAFLCTEDARWINAQRIEASGGMFI